MEFEALVALVKQFGPLVAVVVFFIWRDYRREERMTSRINTLEDEQREVILPLVEKCSTVIAQNTVVMGRLEKALDASVCKYKETCEVLKHVSG